MFQKAQPIFPEGRTLALNTCASFRTVVKSLENTTVCLTAATFYRLEVNGTFVAFGPARTAKGYARVDKIDLSPYHKEGENEVVVVVMGYACRTLSTVYQPSFLIAELTRDGQVIAYTGKDFEAFLPSSHMENVARYSVQRHFMEKWDLTAARGWTDEEDACAAEVLSPAPAYLDRVAPYPYYEDIMLTRAVKRGSLETVEGEAPKKMFYSFYPSEYWGAFDYDGVPKDFEWVQLQKQTVEGENVSLPLSLDSMSYAMLDLDRIETGFLALSATAAEESELVIAFSEFIPESGDFDFTDMHAQNVCTVKLAAGKDLNWLSFEPYVLRYAFVAVKSGSVTLRSFGVKRFQNDVSGLTVPELGDATLAAIYRGAVRTYAHNAVDIFSDCPSRERAGWLCDSYFTGKTEHFLFGKSPVEDAFLENYRLFEGDELLPEGAVPMCYPSDVKPNGEFIPQWTMWYILEVADYLKNRNPDMDKALFRKSIYGLLAFYARYENADGLLEDVPGWNFVEWSAANKWTQNVNYPTNFLYAAVLEAVHELYGDRDCLEKCAHVRKAAVARSFDGKLFHDHALRAEDGSLVLQDDISEICQYYAILFAGIDLTDPAYSYLSHLVKNVFGATRKESLPDIEEINAFIGVYLRLEALLKLGEHTLVLSDIKDFFGRMEQLTGTLWENRAVHGSLDHGFASYAAVAMMKALG